jgi:hypothetical protein
MAAAQPNVIYIDLAELINETWVSTYEKHLDLLSSLKARFMPQLTSEDRELVKFDQESVSTLSEKRKGVSKLQMILSFFDYLFVLPTEDKTQLNKMTLAYYNLLSKLSPQEAQELSDPALAAKYIRRTNLLPEEAVTKLENGTCLDEQGYTPESLIQSIILPGSSVEPTD